MNFISNLRRVSSPDETLDQVKELESLRIEFDSENFSMVVDPQTVLTAIQVGLKIYELFKPKEDSIDEIGRWIETLRTELQNINQELINIKHELQAIQVKIEEVQIKDAEITLLSAIDTYRQHIFDLINDPRNPNLLNTFRDLYFQQISISANKLKRYSYATVFTVGFALKVELELLTALNLSRQSKKQVLTDYLNYFIKCLDVSEPGSIGYVLKAVTNTKTNLEATYRNGDLWYNVFTFKNGCQKVWEDRIRGGSRSWIECDINNITIWYQLNGSLETGFTGNIAKKENLKRIRVDRNAGGILPEADLDSFANNHFQASTLKRYNDQVAPYKVVKESYNLLKEVEKTCLALIEECKRRLQEL